MWTDEQLSLLKQYIDTNDCQYLYKLAEDFKKEGENYTQRAETLLIMAKNAELARK